MVNEDAIKKKKKKKKRQSDVAGLDQSMTEKIKKKKKVNRDPEDGGVKKKKKKKALKNSTMIFDPPDALPNSQEDPQVTESDQELFGSQSPVPSPIKSQQSPKKSQPSPAKIPTEPDTPKSRNGVSENESEADDTPVKGSPVKRPVSRPSPVIKFAKKTKIVNKKVNTEKSPKKETKEEDVESEESESEEKDVLAPLPGAVKEKKHTPAPLSDPVVSQQEQDRRDLTLLIQIKEKFPQSLVKDINWNNLFVFNMKPEEMSARYEVLLRNIPREKDNSTLVNEALLSHCNSKVREVPSSKRGGFPTAADQNRNLKKKLNAFSLFSSQFDLRKISREEVKEQWEALDKTDKNRLRREAKALNNVNGIASGVKPKGPRPISAYMVFSKEHMNNGMKMADIGPMWKNLDESQKSEYQTIADATNRERKASATEPQSQEF